MTATLLILGATGDLAHRYLLPAIGELAASQLLPDDLVIVGAGRDDLHHGEFAERVEVAVSAAGGPRRFPFDVRYERVDASDRDDVARLVSPLPGPVVAYLALPPSLFATVLGGLAGLPAGSRVAIEKPFGTGLTSARELNMHAAAAVGDEAAVHRVDHFLGHATVQNVLGLRFANAVFEPLWDRRSIARVDIAWDETLGVEGRAGYYDHTGAMRDMIQNHLLQLVALIAMEPPVSLAERDLRDRKVDVLRAVRDPDAADPDALVTRARYGAGTVDGRPVAAYVDEPGVDAERNIETFAQLRVFIDNWRWAGVPFTLRSGKSLATAVREITITFRDVPHLAFEQRPRPNQLRLSLDPDTVSLRVNVNASDERFAIDVGHMELSLAPAGLSAYSRVLRDLLDGDAALSIRGDEAEESWRIVEPILDAWSDDQTPLTEYPAGTAGDTVAGQHSPRSS